MISPLIRSQLKCDKCKKVSHTYETCLTIFCPVDNSIKSLSNLRDMIEKPVLLEDAKCDTCREGILTQTKIIIRLPYVLIVALQRFEMKPVPGHNPVYKKLHQYIETPSVLSLEATSDPSLNVAMYNLKGSVLHYGAHPRSGHYVASVPVNAKKARTYNDGNVLNCNSEKALLERSLDGYIHVFQEWHSHICT
jgi:ubiquitin C-terminal hydrolase